MAKYAGAPRKSLWRESCYNSRGEPRWVLTSRTRTSLSNELAACNTLGSTKPLAGQRSKPSKRCPQAQGLVKSARVVSHTPTAKPQHFCGEHGRQPEDRAAPSSG